MPSRLEFIALTDLPEVRAGESLATLIGAAIERQGLALRSDDTLVVAQKIVSKSEGRQRHLSEVQVSSEARSLAERVHKDPRFVELVLRESSEVVRAVPNILITRHRSGHVMANAGIDRSNLSDEQGAVDEEWVLLLPQDCDASAKALREALAPAHPAVIISDSFGRPWREGTVNVALGVAGFPALLDLRGDVDRAGRVLQTTQIALADAVAAGAGLVMGEAREGRPVVLVRGLHYSAPLREARSLLRPLTEDLFR